MTEPRRYRVLASVGRGAHGTVYIAQMLGEGGFSKVVALKIYDGSADDEEVGRHLRDEIHTAARIRHRAAVQLHALLKLDGHWTVAMEYVDGMSIDQLARRDMRVPAGPALDVVREVASALHVASASVGPDGAPLGVVHRDVRDKNIKITEAGGVKILDFGIARAEMRADRGGAKNPRMDGTKGDIYGLGQSLVRALTGHSVAAIADTEQDHQAIIGQAVRWIEEEVGVQAYRINPLVGSMLAYDPAERPTARVLEAACADLRQEIRGPSLRDWAEREIPALAEERTAPRDLPRAVLVETPIAAPPRLPGGNGGPLRVAVAIALGSSFALCVGILAGGAWLLQQGADVAVAATEVLVAGDAKGVSLTRDAAVFALPAVVPAGRYAVEASFTPGKRIGAGFVEVPATGQVSVVCRKELRTCILETS